MLNNCSINTLFIEIYKNQIFIFDFHSICVYMFGLSFLTALNIYKNNFKGRHSWCKWLQFDANVLHKHIVTRDNFL